MSDEEPEDVGPEACIPISSARDPSLCYVQQQCAVPLDVEGGNVYRVTREGGEVHCSDKGLGSASCICWNALYELSGIAATGGCDILGESCFKPNGGFSSEPVCVPAGQSVGAGYCSVQEQCTHSEEIGEGVFAVRQFYSSAECSSTPGTEGAKCSCSDHDMSAQFDLLTGSADLASCNLASDLCGEADSILLSGAIQCSQADQTALADYCYSTFDCSQSGTIDGVDVKVHGSITTDCIALDDAWICHCGSGDVGASLTVEKSGGTPWDDCNAASEACQATIEVQIGQTGGGVRPPLSVPLLRPQTN